MYDCISLVALNIEYNVSLSALIHLINNINIMISLIIILEHNYFNSIQLINQCIIVIINLCNTFLQQPPTDAHLAPVINLATSISIDAYTDQIL